MLIILTPFSSPPKSGVSPMFMGHQTGDMAPSPLYNFGSLVKKPTRHSRFGAWTQNAWNDEVNKKVTKRRSKFFEKWKKKLLQNLPWGNETNKLMRRRRKKIWEEEYLKSWVGMSMSFLFALLSSELLYSTHVCSTDQVKLTAASALLLPSFIDKL